jgi:hypothetical protein
MIKHESIIQSRICDLTKVKEIGLSKVVYSSKLTCLYSFEGVKVVSFQIPIQHS